MDRSDIFYIDDLQRLVDSKALSDFLDERKEIAQGEVNRFVREQNLMSAFGAWTRMNDIDKFRELLKEKIEVLTKESKNGK